MKRKISILTIALFLGIFTVNAQSKAKVLRLIKEAELAKQEFLEADFQMEKHFDNAYAYIIFPNVGKGAFWIGGAAGTGICYENGQIIGVVKMTQINIGLQWGGQAYREIIFFENKKVLDKIKQDNLKVAAQVSAIAATEGASANAEYENGIMIFTMGKGGLMLEASVGGQTFKFKPYVHIRD